LNPKDLLNEIEEVLRTIPPLETRRHETPENQAWLGRTANAIEQWDGSRSAEFSQLVRQFHSRVARESSEAFQQIVVLLHQAQHDLHLQSRRASLRAYQRQLKAQDDVVRASSSGEIPIAISKNLIDLFGEINRAFPEMDLRSFQASGSADALRSQLAAAIERISDSVDTSSKTQASAGEKKIGPTHPDLVFVIHGRQLLGDFHIFLRAIGLKPLEWSEARRRTNKPNPYTWEIVDLALKEAGAIVALFTPDDEARLREHLWENNENAVEKQLLGQPRQNVLFEAGVAYGRDPQRTILVRVGSHRPMSDLSGHHIVQLNDTAQSRQEVANALRAAGCPVDLGGADWYKAGTFNLPDVAPGSSIEQQKARKDAARIRLYKTHVKGSAELLTAAEFVTEIHVLFDSEPEYLNDGSEKFLQKYPRNFRQQLAFNVDEASKKWSLEELKRDVEGLTIDLGG